ncbi:IclR family transcriptional regulator C-terminal domain-containing protein [Bibersteinia trehalosi]|uniref:IclR family transcriptional regulator C-terminal domain-containing protein n=1 Tax=Bibersteinia trehalosi TaxID=47735 RepID=UPI0009EEC8BF|nr:IclR family transcriptional regulator C-terminal domain-containing protein [Bibersteinia trehalosi]
MKAIIIQQLTCHTITQQGKMVQKLNEIRRDGFAMDREENELGVCCLAVPIFNHLGKVEYAISVSTSIHRLNKSTQRTFLTEIQQTAAAISKELGGVVLLVRNKFIYLKTAHFLPQECLAYNVA